MAMDYSGLFASPEDIRMNRIMDLEKQNAAIKQLGGSWSGLLGQIAAGRGAQLAETTASMFGLKTPEEIKAEQAQEAFKSVNAEPGTPEYYYELAKAMKKIDPSKALELVDEGKKREVERERLDMERERIDNQASQFQQTMELRREEFNISKEQWAAMEPTRQAQATLLSLQVKNTEQEMAQGITDRNQKIAYDNIVASVPYDPTLDSPYATYAETVGAKLADAGLGSQAEKWYKQAQDVRNGTLGSNAKPVVTKIDNVIKDGVVGTQVLTNGVETQFYPTDQTDEPLSVAMQNDISRATDAGEEASTRASTARNLVVSLSSLKDFNGGLWDTGESILKNAFGARDIKSEVRSAAIKLRNSAAVQNLPPGVASDKDIELVMKGEPPENAGRDELIRYTRGIAKLAQIEADYYNDKAAWVRIHKDAGGFAQKIELDRAEETFTAVPPEKLNSFFTRYSAAQGDAAKKQEIEWFMDAEGFDPIALQKRMNMAQEALSKMGRL